MHLFPGQCHRVLRQQQPGELALPPVQHQGGDARLQGGETQQRRQDGHLRQASECARPIIADHSTLHIWF